MSNTQQMDPDAPGAQTMNTMMMTMPLVSVFFCFTFPAAIGIYWVVQGAFQIVQQLAVKMCIRDSAEGAFTGSKKGGKTGLFEMADYGTLFLDEIGEASPEVQSKLLRAIETKEIMRIGGDRITSVSYTHLDVYKRQSIPSSISLPVSFISLEVASIRMHSRIGIVVLDDTAFRTILMPVSYTHLPAKKI